MLSLLIVMAVAGCGAQNGKHGSRSSAKNDSKSGPRTAESQSETETGWRPIPTDGSEPKANAQRSDKSSAKSTDSKSSSKTTSARAASQGYAAPAGPGNHVRITQEGCIQFEPRWASVHVGQPIVWTSALSAPVTIHVSSGAFDRSEFTVPAGASVTTGPARGSGSFSIWTDPAACQTVPRGVHGSGPGISVVAR